MLTETLPSLIAGLQPELVLYNAGVDVHAEDALGKMALTDDGILQRDRLVLSACADAQVPVACAIGGGYHEDHGSIVDRHVLLHVAAREQLPRLMRSFDDRQAQRSQGY